MIPTIQLPMADLITALEQASVIQIMAKENRTEVTVDYLPARSSMAIPRAKGDKAPEAYPLQPIKLTFRLEDAMFGGEAYAAIVCGNRVVVAPFIWKGYDALKKTKFYAPDTR